MPPNPRFTWSGHRIDTRVLAGFVGLCGAVLVFLKLASEVIEGDTFAIDRVILTSLRRASDSALPVGPVWLQIAMTDITALGSATTLTLITGLTAGYLAAQRKHAAAAHLVLTTGGGALLGTLLKVVFARPRPDIVTHLVAVHTSSFPSEHAMNSAITYLTLGALWARTQPSRAVRIYLVTVAIVLTLLIGTSRVYLGVHWPSDIVAGWCLGATWATLCSLVEAHQDRDWPTCPDTPVTGASSNTP